MTLEKLEEILAKHKAWLNRDPEGKRADLSGENLQGYNLKGADLRKADLSGTDLSFACLKEANLQRADLSKANLKWAILELANLRKADLSEADLSAADLNEAYLREAILHEANLTNASLKSANLTHAYLSDADLSNIVLGFNFCCGGSWGAPIYQAACGFGSRNATLTLLAEGEPEEWRFFTGCFSGTREELEHAVKETHEGTPEVANYFRAIQYLWETAEANVGRS